MYPTFSDPPEWFLDPLTHMTTKAVQSFFGAVIQMCEGSLSGSLSSDAGYLTFSFSNFSISGFFGNAEDVCGGCLH